MAEYFESWSETKWYAGDADDGWADDRNDGDCQDAPPTDSATDPGTSHAKANTNSPETDTASSGRRPDAIEAASEHPDSKDAEAASVALNSCVESTAAGRTSGDDKPTVDEKLIFKG